MIAGRIVWVVTGVDRGHPSVLKKFRSRERTDVVVVDELLGTVLRPCGESCVAGLAALGGDEDDSVGSA